MTQKLTQYRKDTEPFISCFHVLIYNTSFQYFNVNKSNVTKATYTLSLAYTSTITLTQYELNQVEVI